MSTYFRTSLGARALIALATASVIPAALVIWILAGDLETRIEAAKRILLSEVQLIAAREDTVLARADAFLNGVSLRREVDQGLPATDCEEFLTQRVDRDISFDAVAVLELDGTLRCSSRPTPDWIANPMEGFLSQIGQSHELIVSEVQSDATTSVILLGKALRDQDDRITGLGILSINLTYLQLRAAENVLPEDARVVVIDSASRVLARYPDAEGVVGQRLPENRATQRVLASRGPGTFEEKGLAGEDRIIAHAPLFSTTGASSYHYLLTVPRRVVAGPTLVKAAQSFTILGIVFLTVMSALGFGINRMMLRPLRQLAQASLRLEQGDLSARSGLDHSEDEIGRLAHRFDQSAAAIERREAELAEKAALLDNANDAIIVRDMSNRITFWNRAAEGLYGWSEAEACGQSLADLLQLDPDQIAEATATLRESGKWSGEIEKHKKSGEPVTVLGSWTLLRDRAGVPLSILMIDTDITKRRLLEEQLQQSQKMEAIGRLAGGVAHDFNNLLTVILGYTDILLERTDLDEAAQSALHPISSAAERASALTAQLLGFSRKSILKPQVIDLNATVRDMAGMLTRLIGEDIIFTMVLTKNIEPVVFDPGMLGQVLMNLAINARDAMPDGGLLTIETVNLYIGEDNVRPGQKPGPYVMLAITDTGTGMPPDIRDRIFEPFFTTKPVGKGTGLGLSMVLGLVEQSGGVIGVYSEPGHGTVFKLFLPSTGSSVTPIRSLQTVGNTRGSETILLVEDDVAVRELISASLENLGYRLLIAVDGQDALRLLEDKSDPVDLVLTDVIMPNLSGPGLVAQLKDRFPGVKVLYMSGYTDDVVVRHGLLDSEVWFIQKPFSLTDLARKLRELFAT